MLLSEWSMKNLCRGGWYLTAEWVQPRLGEGLVERVLLCRVCASYKMHVCRWAARRAAQACSNLSRWLSGNRTLQTVSLPATGLSPNTGGGQPIASTSPAALRTRAPVLFLRIPNLPIDRQELLWAARDTRFYPILSNSSTKLNTGGLSSPLHTVPPILSHLKRCYTYLPISTYFQGILQTPSTLCIYLLQLSSKLLQPPRPAYYSWGAAHCSGWRAAGCE